MGVEKRRKQLHVLPQVHVKTLFWYHRFCNTLRTGCDELKNRREGRMERDVAHKQKELLSTTNNRQKRLLSTTAHMEGGC